MTFKVAEFLTLYFGTSLGERCHCKKNKKGVRIETKNLMRIVNEGCAAEEHLEPLIIADMYGDKTCRIYLNEELVQWALARGVPKGGVHVFSRATNAKSEVRGISAIVPFALIGECLAEALHLESTVLNTDEFIGVFPSSPEEIRTSH